MYHPSAISSDKHEMVKSYDSELGIDGESMLTETKDKVIFSKNLKEIPVLVSLWCSFKILFKDNDRQKLLS